LLDIDRSLSNYLPSSLLSTFNRPDVDEITVDAYLKDVLEYSFRMHKQSKGMFDLTVSPLVNLWGFGPDKNTNIPDSNLIASTLKKVGMDKLIFKNGILKKREKNVSIDVNGIAQGYSVDVLANLLLRKGIKDFMIEIGGEIIVKGTKPNQEPFKIAIQRPHEMDKKVDYVVLLKDKAITTSGNYEQYRKYQGRKISHHIHPKTGYPIEGSIISATVIADTAMEADALDNVFITMRPDQAIRFANARKKIDIYLIYEEGGIIKEAYSNNFSTYLLPSQ